YAVVVRAQRADRGANLGVRSTANCLNDPVRQRSIVVGDRGQRGLLGLRELLETVRTDLATDNGLELTNAAHEIAVGVFDADTHTLSDIAHRLIIQCDRIRAVAYTVCVNVPFRGINE